MAESKKWHVVLIDDESEIVVDADAVQKRADDTRDDCEGAAKDIAGEMNSAYGIDDEDKAYKAVPVSA